MALPQLSPSYFKLHVRWLRSLTRITYLSKLIGIPSLAACMKLELFRVYLPPYPLMKMLMHKNEFLCVIPCALILTTSAYLQIPCGFSSLRCAILLSVGRQFC
ncbi:hypothetical protein CUU52_12620 [Pectobacterium polaris]|nr:hypothetical protein [Pectobacterium polaris]